MLIAVRRDEIRAGLDASEKRIFPRPCKEKLTETNKGGVSGPCRISEIALCINRDSQTKKQSFH
jgi:hypothetical protein